MKSLLFRAMGYLVLLGGVIALSACAEDPSAPDAAGDAGPGEEEVVGLDGEDGEEFAEASEDGAGGQEQGGCIEAYPGQVLITEIMSRPEAAAGRPGQFIELYNKGYEALSMQGWQLRDGECGSAPLGLPAGVDFEAGDFVLLAFEDDGQINGGLEPDLLLAGISLESRLLFIVAGEVEVDRVAFNCTEWPNLAGVSMNLDPTKHDLMMNDLPGSWCAATSSYGDGDLGTPGPGNTVCVLPECGNGEREAQEQCDDGKNGDDQDGCRDDCSFSCQDPGSDCSDSPGDCLKPVCMVNTLGQDCGNVPDDEDRPAAEGDCSEGMCVDGTASQRNRADGIACDNQSGVPGDYCREGVCIDPVCGDEWKGSLEECDDGNTDGGDGCSSDCLLEFCGNQEIDDGEQCDDGRNGDDLDGCLDFCSFTCQDPGRDCTDFPGDCLTPGCAANTFGQVCADEPADEDRPDDGKPCTVGECSEGVSSQLNRDDGSLCDNSAGLPGDYCQDGFCIDPICGDNIKGPLEACEDGNAEDGDGCSSNCELEFCGNGQPEGGEQCDDGKNGDDLDGCRDDCRFTCADPQADCSDVPGDCQAFVCVPNQLGQVCAQELDQADLPDDGNACTFDLCAANGVPSHPEVQDGLACNNQAGSAGDYCLSGACIDPICGDGIEGALEDCDDGNFDPCDGCLPTCQIHQNVCGDGITCPPTETCDDGNALPGDGCAPGCLRQPGSCPPDMVFVPAAPALGVSEPFCMDSYEASRADATAVGMGGDINKAVSQPGVIPWYTNPINATVFEQMQAACQAAGKRICAKEEFYSACSEAGQNSYVFGDVFDRETCNCVDTFCDDYCLAHDIAPCSTAANCGYTYYCFKVVPTWSFPSCTNSYGTFDINGNVWEVVPSATDARGYEVRGGAFNCASASARLQCSYNAGWTSLFAGFRCCRDY